MTQSRHMKLSDLESQTNYLLPKTSKFDDAYPTIEKLRVEVRAHGEGFQRFTDRGEWLDVYDLKSMVAILDCRNPRCYRGGLNLDHLLRWEIVERGLTEYETTVGCRGYEGSPKGRKNDGPCDTYFEVMINVTYKPTTAS